MAQNSSGVSLRCTNAKQMLAVVKTTKWSAWGIKLTLRHRCAFFQFFGIQKRIFSTTLAVPFGPKHISHSTRTTAQGKEEERGEGIGCHMMFQNTFCPHVIGRNLAGKNYCHLIGCEINHINCRGLVTSAWFRVFPQFFPNLDIITRFVTDLKWF